MACARTSTGWLRASPGSRAHAHDEPPGAGPTDRDPSRLPSLRTDRLHAGHFAVPAVALDQRNLPLAVDAGQYPRCPWGKTAPGAAGTGAGVREVRPGHFHTPR